MQQNNQQLQDSWSSKWAFILATTGAAVGLGNVWRFPYMAGVHGGSAFVLIYLICVIIIGLPIMIAEILIGRRAKQNPVDALITLARESNHSSKWGLLGWWGALALVLVLSFYSVVSGWSIAYLIQSLSGKFQGLDAKQVAGVWQHFLSDPWRMLLWHTVFMALTIGVIMRGVQQGLEKATKFMMPALYLILIALVTYAAIYGDFAKAVHFLFDFDSSKITTSTIIAAMGHAFFTLALGAGAILTYGAYMPRKVNIPGAVAIVAALDVLVAVLSGLAIFPIVFAHHLSPASGPGLMYVTLPITFAHMSVAGRFIGALFFILLLFAAWTSSINIAEPLVIILQRKLSLKRNHAALIVGFFAWFIGIGSLLSFNVWKHVQIAGLTVFGFATNFPTDIILPIGGLGFAIFTGYVMRKAATKEELQTKLYPLWRILIRYVAPLGILIVFLSSIIH